MARSQVSFLFVSGLCMFESKSKTLIVYCKCLKQMFKRFNVKQFSIKTLNIIFELFESCL